MFNPYSIGDSQIDLNEQIFSPSVVVVVVVAVLAAVVAVNNEDDGAILLDIFYFAISV